mmetsp:Transcript_23062/g.87209  ORF Transcript_23062/g.87209 Transcript_23062/m.87209 type:complete len:211 (+) Transcript_23062:696-1328(+)
MGASARHGRCEGSQRDRNQLRSRPVEGARRQALASSQYDPVSEPVRPCWRVKRARLRPEHGGAVEPPVRAVVPAQRGSLGRMPPLGPPLQGHNRGGHARPVAPRGGRGARSLRADAAAAAKGPRRQLCLPLRVDGNAGRPARRARGLSQGLPGRDPAPPLRSQARRQPGAALPAGRRHQHQRGARAAVHSAHLGGDAAGRKDGEPPPSRG